MCQVYLLLSDNLEFFGKLELKYFKDEIKFSSKYKSLVLNYFEEQRNIGQYKIVLEDNQKKVLYSPLATVNILYSGELGKIVVKIFSGSKENLEGIILDLKEKKDELEELSEKEFKKDYPEPVIIMENGTGNSIGKVVTKDINNPTKKNPYCEKKDSLLNGGGSQDYKNPKVNSKMDNILRKINDFGESVANFLDL